MFVLININLSDEKVENRKTSFVDKLRHSTSSTLESAANNIGDANIGLDGTDAISFSFR